MKPPTKAELQALAVRALGEGAVVSVYLSPRGFAECYAGDADRFHEIRVEYSRKSTATRALAAALRALALPACGWTETDEGAWHTGCGKMFVLETGTPKENEMAWCCYCGRALAGEE